MDLALNTAAAVSDPLAGYVSLRELAPRVGSYFSAYSLAVAGKFGPAIIVGRTQLYSRDLAEAALARRAAERAARAPLIGSPRTAP